MKNKPLKVTVCYALLYRFRVPIFQRLADHPNLSVNFLVGKGVKGAKHACADDNAGLNVVSMKTFGVRIVTSGRVVPLSFNPSLLFHLIKTNPDVLLIQGGEVPNNLVILTYAKIFRKKIVWWSLGEVQGRTYSKPAQAYRKLVQFIEKRCDVYLGYSSTSGQYFLDQGYDPSLVYSLVNVVDTEQVKALIPEDRKHITSIKNKIGINNEIVLLFVGSLTETKGITRLIKAVSALEDLDFHLVIVGDGIEREKAERLTHEKKLGEKVTFVGAIYKNVGSYFEMGDILVMPGTGGLVVSEGMTHGLPVICSVGDGSEQDLVKDGINGFIIPPDNVIALTDILRQCLEKPEMLNKMGEASLDIIKKQHNIESYMRTMFKAIFCANSQSNPNN